MAPRANWKGYLRLSLVSCPIALYQLGGCVGHPLGLKYARTDGAPVDAGQEQATLARCKGEGPIDPRKDIDACMARNGYILVRQ